MAGGGHNLLVSFLNLHAGGLIKYSKKSAILFGSHFLHLRHITVFLAEVEIT